MKMKILIALSSLLFFTKVFGDAPTDFNHIKLQILKTASQHPSCQRIQPFFLEIGDTNEILVSKTIGGDWPTREAILPIASSSKWVFAAYVLEKRNGKLDLDDINTLTMQSGHTKLEVSSCIDNNFETVAECANYGSNLELVENHIDRFYYNNGHYQKWAMNNNLGPMNSEKLSQEINQFLNLGKDLSFSNILLGGGMSLSASSYADFLAKILKRDLHMGTSLGLHSVCTWGEECPSSSYSPVELPDYYSLGHWIESFDGAFSSAGLFGFYPWINQQKDHYGVISRFSVDFSDGIGYGPGFTSMLCGQAIRSVIKRY